MALKHFIEEVVARLKGDDNGVIAAKNARKAESALNGQIQALKSALVDEESSVEDANEALANAKFPTTLISNNQAYVDKIRDAQEDYDETVERMAGTEASIDYFEKLKLSFEG